MTEKSLFQIVTEINDAVYDKERELSRKKLIEGKSADEIYDLGPGLWHYLPPGYLATRRIEPQKADLSDGDLYTILSREFTFAEAEESDDVEVRAWLADDPDYQAGDRKGWLVIEREAIGAEVQELVAQGWAVKEW